MEEAENLTKRQRKKLNKENSAPEHNFNYKILVVVAIVAIAAGVFWLMYRSGNSNSGASESVRTGTLSEIGEDEIIKGSREAGVVLVEYADFQCPACAAYFPIMKRLVEEYPEDLKIVFRHLPLRSIHRHAQIASQAAEAAGSQGKFFEFAEILYSKQDEWTKARDPRNIFVEYAGELGLDQDAFKEYMNSNTARDKVNADYESAVALGLNGTPSYFVNGDRIDNPQGFEPFRQLIQSYVDKIKEIGSQDTPSDNAEDKITPTL